MKRIVFFILDCTMFFSLSTFCMDQFLSPQFPFVADMSLDELQQTNREYRKWEKKEDVALLQDTIKQQQETIKYLRKVEKNYDKDVGRWRTLYHASDKSWHQMRSELEQSKSEVEILQREINSWESVKNLKPVADNLCEACKTLPLSYDQEHPCLEKIKSTADAFSGKIEKKPLLLIGAAQNALKGAKYLIKEFINQISHLKTVMEQNKLSSESTIQGLEQKLIHVTKKNERLEGEKSDLKGQLQKATENFAAHDKNLCEMQQLLGQTKKSLEDALTIKKDTTIQDSQALIIASLSDESQKNKNQRNMLASHSLPAQQAFSATGCIINMHKNANPSYL